MKFLLLLILFLSMLILLIDINLINILNLLGWIVAFCYKMGYEQLKLDYRQNSPAFDAKLKFKEILRREEHNCGDADYK